MLRQGTCLALVQTTNTLRLRCPHQLRAPRPPKLTTQKERFSTKMEREAQRSLSMVEILQGRHTAELNRESWREYRRVINRGATCGIAVMAKSLHSDCTVMSARS